MAVASALLKTVMIGIIGMPRPVLAPVIAMVVSPGPLRLTLIGAVVGVTPQLALLPAPPALALTSRQGAITLLRDLSTRPECLPACRAPPALHGCVSAHKKRQAWSTPSVDDNHADSHQRTAGRKQVSGSIPMSEGGSIVVSAEVHALDMLIPEPGAIYVMDRGYIDFARLHTLHQAGAFFVTRAKSNLNAHRVYSAATDRTTGVIADQTIALDGARTSQDYPVHLRRIRFRDPETAKTLIFLTNQTVLPALTICDLYKSRWQVELFFKWIKQHLRIKRFYGTSENAVKTQIWIAVSVYVLVAIVRKRLNLEASLYTLLQVFSMTVFEKIEIQTAFSQSADRYDTGQDDNQLDLFNF
jgi:hypothetical protein